MTKKCNLEDIIKTIEAVHPNITVPSDQEYKGTHTKIKYICKIDDHGEQMAIPSSLKRGQGCPRCGRESMARKNRSSIHSFKKIVEEIHPNITVPTNQEYKNSQSKIRYVCEKHGEKMATPASLKSGQGCLDCGYERLANQKRSNIHSVKKMIERIHPNITVPTNQKYKNNMTKIKYICKINDHGEQIGLPASLKSGKGCPQCSHEKLGDRRRCDWGSVIEIIENLHKNIKVPFNQEYKNNRTNIKYICEDHGQQMATSDNLKSGKGCPECAALLQLWNKEAWSEYCRKGKGNPIMYWIKMTWENQSWYKFGITYKGVKKRFAPSEYKDIDIEVIKTVTGEPEYIWDLEHSFHIFYARSHRLPPVEFAGETECYPIDVFQGVTLKDIITPIINKYPGLNDCNFLVSDAA